MQYYNVPYKQLTPLGMLEMEELGKHIRQIYVEKKKLLSPSLSMRESTVHPQRFESYFRSDSAPRCAQSAQSMAMGLYPDGTGPAPFHKQPVAVVQQLLENEWMFCAPKNKCLDTKDRDVEQYMTSRGLELIMSHKDILDRLAASCNGVSVDQYPFIEGGENIFLGLKDVVDALTFDNIQHIPSVKGNVLTAQDMIQLKDLQFKMLMDCYFDTDRKVTYWSSGFPREIMSNIFEALDNDADSIKYYSYHGHRELLYAIGALLGWQFDFPDEPRGHNGTAIPFATTLFFELHGRPVCDVMTPSCSSFFSEQELGEPLSENNTWLEFYVWTPREGRQSVQLSKCASNPCIVADFISIIQEHFAETGEWEDICEVTREEDSSPVIPVSSRLELSLLVNVLLIIVVVVQALYFARVRKVPYNKARKDDDSNNYKSSCRDNRKQASETTPLMHRSEDRI